MSTCSVYGHSNSILKESSRKKPLSLYAKTKIDAENMIMKKSKDSCIFRLGTLYGQGDYYSRLRLDLVVNILTMKAVLGQKLEVFGGNQWRPLLHVRDVAFAILFAVTNDMKGIYSIEDGGNVLKSTKEDYQNIVEVLFGTVMPVENDGASQRRGGVVRKRSESMPGRKRCVA